MSREVETQDVAERVRGRHITQFLVRCPECGNAEARYRRWERCGKASLRAIHWSVHCLACEFIGCDAYTERMLYAIQCGRIAQGLTQWLAPLRKLTNGWRRRSEGYCSQCGEHTAFYYPVYGGIGQTAAEYRVFCPFCAGADEIPYPEYTEEDRMRDIELFDLGCMSE